MKPVPIDLKKLPKLDKAKYLVLVAAVGAGIAAVVLTNAHIKRTIEEVSNTEQVKFLMDKVQTLEAANQEMRQRQEAYANQMGEQLNRLAQEQAKRPQQAAQKEPASRPQSLALRTPPGKRAVTFNITPLSAVGGLLNPGDFVDVLVSLASDPEGIALGQGAKEKTTFTLFQNVQILAIGANVDTPADFQGQQKTSSLIVTFALDPQQAELMAFAKAYGELQLALRNPDESGAFRLPSANWKTFVNYIESTQGLNVTSPSSPKPAEPKKEAPPQIQVYRAGASQGTAK